MDQQGSSSDPTQHLSRQQATHQQQQQQQQHQHQDVNQQIAASDPSSRTARMMTTGGHQHLDGDALGSNISHQHQQQYQQSHNQQQHHGIDPQIMGQLMTNPALAVVAAASPLFPPAAMITNPGALLAMPEYYTSAAAMQKEQSAKGSAAAISSSVAIQAQQVSAGDFTHRGGGQVISQQLQQQQQQQHAMFVIPGMQLQPILPYMTGLNPSTGMDGQSGQYLAPSSMQSHLAAANAATSQALIEDLDMMLGGVGGSKDGHHNSSGKRKKDLTQAERARQNRDRNREHARSTRLRKKAYIQKLKELVEGLHTERTEEVRQRRVAIQHLAEMQNVRRAVIRSFLRLHSNPEGEGDRRRWSTILEDAFWLKQPVTPYRCFRRSEIENECRVARGVDGVMEDAASLAVMVEGVGSRNPRWLHIKREDFLLKEEERTGRKRMPRSIMQQSSRFQHAVSSLSSSSNSSNNGSSGEDSNRNRKRSKPCSMNTSNVSSSPKTSSVDDKVVQEPAGGGEFHDYHAMPLPDPKLPDQGTRSASLSGDDRPEDTNSGDDTKRTSTDISSGDYSAAAIKESGANKRPRVESTTSVQTSPVETAGIAAAKANGNFLPLNIAKKGGIAHNIRPVVAIPPPKNGNARLALAPAVQVPPFAGLGKRINVIPMPAAISNASTSAQAIEIEPSRASGGKHEDSANVRVAPASSKRSDLASASGRGPTAAALGSRPAVISGDIETSSSNSSKSKAQIRAYYHLNEDDMILMEDIIMCPFVYRTQGAVASGALAECVTPGMLRAHFSSRNKLLSMEMIYDSMGFMQQLERASGSEAMAQIIPGSLEMALSPTSDECRVITLAASPFRIVNVNEAWTKLTKYTQMEAEGVELFTLLESPGAETPPSSPPYSLEEVTKGRCKCTTRFHCDKDGREFVDFIASYPLTNASDEVTHILHVSKELQPPIEGAGDIHGSIMNDSNEVHS